MVQRSESTSRELNERNRASSGQRVTHPPHSRQMGKATIRGIRKNMQVARFVQLFFGEIIEKIDAALDIFGQIIIQAKIDQII